MEVWKATPLTPAFVEISDCGRVRVLDRLMRGKGIATPQMRKGKILSPWKGQNGYLHVSIQFDGKRHKFLVHRLLASVFCPGFDDRLTVNHIDGNKTNNDLQNLEWVTLGRNTQLQWETGLVNLRGEANPGSKLNELQVAEIRLLCRRGVRKVEIAEQFGVSAALIYKIHEGTRWAASA